METLGGVRLDKSSANPAILQLIGSLSVMEFAVFAGREAIKKNGAETRIRLHQLTQSRLRLGKS